MLRRVLSAAIVMVICVGIAMADEIRAVITKVDGNKITFAPVKGKQRGEEKTMTAADNVKVIRGKIDPDTKKFEATGDLKNGLQNKMFTNISEKGVRATVVTEGDKITEIRVVQRKKKQ
jgi:hypothetical protein